MKTKRYTKQSEVRDWTGKNTMPISTTNHPYSPKYRESPLWCPDCGKGQNTCKCPGKDEQPK